MIRRRGLARRRVRGGIISEGAVLVGANEAGGHGKALLRGGCRITRVRISARTISAWTISPQTGSVRHGFFLHVVDEFPKGAVFLVVDDLNRVPGGFAGDTGNPAAEDVVRLSGSTVRRIVVVKSAVIESAGLGGGLGILVGALRILTRNRVGAGHTAGLSAEGSSGRTRKASVWDRGRVWHRGRRDLRIGRLRILLESTQVRANRAGIRGGGTALRKRIGRGILGGIRVGRVVVEAAGTAKTRTAKAGVA